MQIKYLVIFLLLISTVINSEIVAETSEDSSKNLPEPEVTIIKNNEENIEEYRIYGKLYMIKVIPKVGAAYYLVDNDGDGNLETRQNSLEPNILIPMWILFKW